MDALPAISGLKRVHARRLRDVYRSASWPHQDLIEIELLAAGVLEQVKAAFEDFFTSNGSVVEFETGIAAKQNCERN